MVFDIYRLGFRFLQQLVLINRTESDHVLRSGNPGNQGGLYYLVSPPNHLPMDCHTGACSFVEVDDHYEPPACIYGDEEYENINEIFPNHYGATQVSFLKSLVIDMMCHLRQLGEMCIFPNGHHFYRGK
ncbi:import receptor subunit tom40 [Fusarium oxysporum f. sp. albedinis]|nr:import receptor subunit tom40 [Fusarium oxysporum f. sp. albedinis]